jgi:hypothetical protein
LAALIIEARGEQPGCLGIPRRLEVAVNAKGRGGVGPSPAAGDRDHVETLARHLRRHVVP